MSETPVEQSEVQETPPVTELVEEVKAEPVAPKPAPKPRKPKAAPPVEEKETPPNKPDLVAVYSDHPVFWPGVGSIGKGYTLMPPAVAKKWTDRGLAKEASPDEVAKAYGA